MKQQINEIKRMQFLAGLNESQLVEAFSNRDESVYQDFIKLDGESKLKFFSKIRDWYKTASEFNVKAGLPKQKIVNAINIFMEEYGLYVKNGNDEGDRYDIMGTGSAIGESYDEESIGNENNLFNIINSNKNGLAKKFTLNIKSSMVSAVGDEDEPVQILDNNGDWKAPVEKPILTEEQISKYIDYYWDENSKTWIFFNPQ
jgi:hypothetical protein